MDWHPVDQRGGGEPAGDPKVGPGPDPGNTPGEHGRPADRVARPSEINSKPTVVIHTNDRQLLAAMVSAYSLRSRSQYPDGFDVRILRLEETPPLCDHEGEKYFWWDEAKPTVWRRTDAFSFAPLRRMVPELLGYTGRALVIDPDVFAIGDVYELLSRDMQGKAILCRRRTGHGANGVTLYSSAVMLLDCAKLTDWDFQRELEALFSGEVRLGPLLSLVDVAPESIGLFEDEWNDLDNLTTRTKLLHNTELSTQPWKAGLRADSRQRVPRAPAMLGWLWLQATLIQSKGAKKPILHRAHPDPNQERLFLTLLDQCLVKGDITEQFVRTAIRRRYVRKDLLSLVHQLRRENHQAGAHTQIEMNRPGIPGGSIPWKRGWSHGEEASSIRSGIRLS